MKTSFKRTLALVLSVVIVLAAFATCFIPAGAEAPTLSKPIANLEKFKADMVDCFEELTSSGMPYEYTEEEIGKFTNEAILYLNSAGSLFDAVQEIFDTATLYDTAVNSSALMREAFAKAFIANYFTYWTIYDCPEIFREAADSPVYEESSTAVYSGAIGSDILPKAKNKLIEAAETGNGMTLHSTILALMPAVNDEIYKVLGDKHPEFYTSLLKTAFAQDITLTVGENGKAEINATGIPGERIEVSTTADYGYVAKYTVYKTGDKNTKVDTYSNVFVMPEFDVTVEVSFVKDRAYVGGIELDSNNNPTYKYTYLYDELTNTYTSYGYNYVNQVFVPNYKSTKQYNEYEDTVFSFEENYNTSSGAFVPSSKYEGVFSGSVYLGGTYYDFSDGEWKISNKYECSYQENGYVELGYVPSGAEYRISQIYSNAINKTDYSTIEQSISMGYNADGSISYGYRYDYTLDANGKTLTETDYEYVSGQWVLEKTIKYVYNCNGIEQAHFAYNSANVMYWARISELDKYGNELSNCDYSHSLDSAPTGRYCRTIDYDRGECTKTIDYNIQGSTETEYYRFEYLYDENDCMSGYKVSYYGNYEYGEKNLYETQISSESKGEGEISVKSVSHYTDMVEVTVVPSTGYELTSLTLISGEESSAIVFSNGMYSFEMPDNDVKVVAEFNMTEEYRKSHFPELISGDNQTVDGTGSSAAVFESEAPIDEFVSVKVNGEVLSSACYTVDSGATRITLNSEYVKGLQNGSYSLEIVSANASVVTSFTVEGHVEPTPVTGDGILVFAIFAIVALGAAVIVKKKLTY